MRSPCPGGPAAAPQDVVLRVTRDGQTAELPLMALRTGGPDDLQLRAGDRGRTHPAPTHAEPPSVRSAASARSPSTRRPSAWPKPLPAPVGRATCRRTPARYSSFATIRRGPTIYRVDLLTPSGYFLAQRFAMRDKDLIYVANAAANQPTKLVDIINRLFSPVFTVRELTR